jgi:transcriptional regulator GlxA family with amidase domain
VAAEREGDGVQVAMALSPGVSADECEAFAAVFEHLDGAELVGVGERLGAVGGPGGGYRVEALFDDVQHPDVVLVPGGLGCARAAADPVLLDWIRSVAPRCDWLVASSTGTVVVAAAGLLGHQPAATHWLAGDQLAAHGSSASTERIVEIDNIITCEGYITAMHVALLVTLRLAGPAGVAQVRERLAAASAPPPERSRWTRWRDRNRPSGPSRPRNRELDAPDVIEFDPLVIHPR